MNEVEDWQTEQRRRASVVIWYDRNGNEIPDGLGHVEKLLTDPDYKILKQDEVGVYWVSTVWLGLDHSFGYGPPLIFETMVFPLDDGRPSHAHDFDMIRYATEAEAFAGHEQMVTLVRASLLDVPDDLSAEDTER